MAQYYYDVNDSVWSTWSNSDLKPWLVAHNIIKSDVQVQREKLTKLIEGNYTNAQDTMWEAWSDSQMCDWLAEHGEKTVLVKRDNLVKLMRKKYNETAGLAASYLTWLGLDARLRAYLHNHDIDDSALPMSRPGLLCALFSSDNPQNANFTARNRNRRPNQRPESPMRLVYCVGPAFRAKGAHKTQALWIADVGVAASARRITSGLFNDRDVRSMCISHATLHL
ncbi:hypothetical protein B0H14DRAFT_1634140 [Mycena olivaceomarginata]|nr:hypothetical protein B0H14DRAFT_1634140 [Mycena olivaceomarginata]